ncbi:retrovirus-related Pol polyprotein from transposon 412 [Trichonephila clavipes]|nr:retrovirus-related Pol polyprotein from transposon 412 [Trichonephila clavipes]
MGYFTKWSQASAISYQEASNVSEVLVQLLISRYGVSLQLHSNQGRNFDSAFCKRLCEILGIDKTWTTTLHPQSRIPLIISKSRSILYEVFAFFKC